MTPNQPTRSPPAISRAMQADAARAAARYPATPLPDRPPSRQVIRAAARASAKRLKAVIRKGGAQ